MRIVARIIVRVVVRVVALSSRVSFAKSGAEPRPHEAPKRLICDVTLALTVLKVRRNEEFAPVKNREGEDSPETARRLLLELHRRWLLQAGLTTEQLAGREIEIPPLISCSGEGLTAEALKALGVPEG